MAAALKAEPDWRGAARSLVESLAGLPEPDRRVDLLERCCLELGDALYPALVKLFAAVARFGDAPVRALAAESLADAIVTARLPSVRLPAWGAGRFPGGSGFGGLQFNTRSLGPVEFLCVWLQRDMANEVLTEDAFERAMALLLELVDASPRARALYVEKLRADAEDPVEGLHTREGRQLLASLAEQWGRGEPPAAIARKLADTARAQRAADRWTFPAR